MHRRQRLRHAALPTPCSTSRCGKRSSRRRARSTTTRCGRGTRRKPGSPRSPAPPEVAVQIYNRGTMPTMVAKLQSGQSIKDVDRLGAGRAGRLRSLADRRDRRWATRPTRPTGGCDGRRRDHCRSCSQDSRRRDARQPAPMVRAATSSVGVPDVPAADRADRGAGDLSGAVRDLSQHAQQEDDAVRRPVELRLPAQAQHLPARHLPELLLRRLRGDPEGDASASFWPT